MPLTLSQAAKEIGKSKSTLTRAIKSGRLSATRHDDASYSIEPAELFRVFPKGVAQPVAGGDAPQPTQPDNAAQAEVLRIKVEMLEQQLERERDTVADLRKRLDRAEDRVFALTNETQRAQLVATPPQEQPDATPKGLFARLFGGR